MLQDGFRVVFDVAEAGYRHWTFPAFGLIFVTIGTGLILYRHLRPKHETKAFRRLFPYLYTGFATFWTLVAFTSTYSEYLGLRNAVLNGQCRVVEGTITKFVPMPREGHVMEYFVVNGHHYEYSDYVVTAGFNNTRSHGGPLREGLHVRICDVGGAIARLEIAE